MMLAQLIPRQAKVRARPPPLAGAGERVGICASAEGVGALGVPAALARYRAPAFAAAAFRRYGRRTEQ